MTPGLTVRRALLLTALVALLPGAWPRAAAAAELSLLFTGDVMGEIEACECEGQPFGGVAQRAYLVSEHRRESGALVLDAGNLLFRSLVAVGPDAGDYRKVNALALVDAYGLMAVDAVNVGPRDLVAGLEYLQRLQRRASFPFLSSNLVDPDTGDSIFTPQLVLDRDGASVAVLGVLPGGMVGRGYVTTDPLDAVRDAAAQARADGADRVVLLSALGLDDSRVIARKVRDLDAVLVAGERTHTDPPPRVRGTPLVAAGSRGKFLVEVVLATPVVETRFIPVERGGPVDEEVEVLVKEARARQLSPYLLEAGPEAVP